MINRKGSILSIGLLTLFIPFLSRADTTENRGLIWPINCIPGDQTCSDRIGYPDIDGDGKAFNCSQPGYRGHQGTDINLRSWAKMDSGVSVLAAADGEVLWVFDGKYDRCPNPAELDCQAPPNDWAEPGKSNGYRVCTELGDYCGIDSCCCFWCFDGGNVVVVRHRDTGGVFATRYDHLKKNSIRVSPGDLVRQGQKIAEVGSSGRSSFPHLHFEVWGTGFYELTDPWAGPCGPNFFDTLWESNPPWNTLCPIETLLITQNLLVGDQTGKDLELFRFFRDTVLTGNPVSKDLVDRYYQHSNEVNQIMSENPDLMWETSYLLLEALPAVRSATENGGKLYLDRATFSRAIQVADKYKALASNDLFDDLEAAERFVYSKHYDTESGQIMIDFMD